MYPIKSNFYELYQKFAEESVDLRIKLAVVAALFDSKAAFCMEDFFLIMRCIVAIEIELEKEKNLGVECYSVTPNDSGDIIWTGYGSQEVLRKEKNPVPNFTRRWEVIMLKDHADSKKRLGLVYFFIDEVKWDVTQMFFEMHKGKIDFWDVVMGKLKLPGN